VRGRWLIALAVLGALPLAAVVMLAQDKEVDGPAAIVKGPTGPFRGGQLPAGLGLTPAPRFRLQDARGQMIDSDALRGRPYVLTFLYTDCQDVCPLIGAEIGAALRLLGSKADDTAAVAVTVDPEGDTPSAVRTWLRRHRLPRNFHYLLGTRRRLRPLWRAYFAAPQPRGVPESKHTASIWLIDRRGRLRTKFSGGAPVPPRDIAHDLRLLLRETAPAVR
jgi:protein SCO1/2